MPAIIVKHVTPAYRGKGDPQWPVPDSIPCPDCGSQAMLTAYIVGYGYDCGRCGMQAPIVVPEAGWVPARP